MERYHGRPADATGRPEKELRCYDALDALGIAYDRVDHPHADTIDACLAIEGCLGAKICKNLFLCNRQKTDFYLLLLPGDKPAVSPLPMPMQCCTIWISPPALSAFWA